MFSRDPFQNIRQIIKTPAHLMRTFALHQPLDTHFRVATCREVDCEAWRNGFRMGFDLTDPDRLAAARRVRDHSGRRMSAEVVGNPPTRVVLTFPPGQECFQTHRVSLERDPLMIVRGGDFRGNPTGQRMRHTSADSFLDHWSSDLDKILTVHERG